MKKQILKVISITSAAAMLLQMGVAAFGGTYPESTGYTGIRDELAHSKLSYSETSHEYLFEVDGKKFILLDTDAEGNYFVMTDDVYGLHEYDTSYSNKPVIESVSVVDGVNVFTAGPGAEVVDSEWTFDITDSDNIGYWLNNDFWNNGNGTGNALPESIKSYVLETEWKVEGMEKAAINWTANMYYYDIYKDTMANDFATTRVVEPYTTTGKLALMSYTEYAKYQDIIGLVHGYENWRGFMLRTPFARVSAGAQSTTNDKLVYTWGGGMIKNTSVKGAAEPKAMVSCVNDSPATANMLVRPVMWLSKDIFKNVKVNTKTTGSIVKEEIAKNSLEDLKKLYGDAEINSIMGNTASWDWGYYPASDKHIKTGDNVKVVDGIVGDSPAKGLFTIGGRRFILLDRNLEGEYFVMADEEYGNSTIMGSAWITAYRTKTADEIKAITPAEWLFDVTLTDTPMWKLNNDKWGLLSKNSGYGFGYEPTYTGDKNKKVLPDAIADSVVEKTWNIEPVSPILGWKINSYGSGAVKSETSAWAQRFTSDNTVQQVNAKVMLMSATEYETYKDKIGFKNFVEKSIDANGNVSNYRYAGVTLRTQVAYATCPDNGASWSAQASYAQVGLDNTDKEVTDSGKEIRYNFQSLTDNKYMIRPVMWLEKDFFKNNKIDLDTAGDDVLAEMRDLYSPRDLIDTYSSEEVEKILGQTITWDWGYYPDSKTAITTGEGVAVQGGIAGPSPEENLFTIGGRRFILLDRNKEGEYFVMTDEEYGTTPLMNSTWIAAFKEKTADEKKAMTSKDFLIDPTDTDSATWKLNNNTWGLLSKDSSYGFGYRYDEEKGVGYTGDRTRKVLPAAIVDNLVEKDWNIEPATPMKAWEINSYGSDTVKEEVNSYLENIKNTEKGNTVTAKVMWMSASEYETYKSKIGFTNYVSGAEYAGIYLRTQIFKATCTNTGNESIKTDSWTVNPTYVQVFVSNPAAESKQVQYGTIGMTDNPYMVRPVMWLAKDFFKNNKIDVATAGENVRCEIRDLYDAEDLTIYTEAELAELGLIEKKEIEISVTYDETNPDAPVATAISATAPVVNSGTTSAVIVAAYNGGSLVGVTFENVDFTDVAEGESTLKTVLLNNLNGADICKVMVWNAIDSMIPQNVKEFEI